MGTRGKKSKFAHAALCVKVHASSIILGALFLEIQRCLLVWLSLIAPGDQMLIHWTWVSQRADGEVTKHLTWHSDNFLIVRFHIAHLTAQTQCFYRWERKTVWAALRQLYQNKGMSPPLLKKHYLFSSSLFSIEREYFHCLHYRMC